MMAPPGSNITKADLFGCIGTVILDLFHACGCCANMPYK